MLISFNVLIYLATGLRDNSSNRASGQAVKIEIKLQIKIEAQMKSKEMKKLHPFNIELTKTKRY